MRKEFEMTKEQFDELARGMTPSPMIALQCGQPLSIQDRANASWCRLGDKMGFDGMTVLPVPGKSGRFFTSVPK